MVDIAVPRPAPARPITLPAPAGAITRLRRLARRRFPRSLLLAVLGIVLSSWLIPAVTRQWDDRQKAGELKAALVGTMATATGRALMDAQAASAVPAGDRPATGSVPAAGKEWAVAALEIRSRVDAYFDAEAVDRWDLVNQYVNSTLMHAYRTAAGDAFIPGSRLANRTSKRLQTLYLQYLDDDATIDGLETEILNVEQDVARDFLAMHVRGYNTTWHDVVNDLLPNV